jgi:hypothetical protein
MIATALASVQEQLAETNRRLSNIMRPGQVTDVDYAKGLVKVKVGDLDSYWVPWAERAGGIKTWSPPSVGEQIHLMSPSGEPGQGWVLPGGYSDQNPQPHDKGNENVLVIGNTKIIATGSGLKIESGSIELAGPTKVTGASLTHNDRNIGDNHTHKGVLAGLASTQDPN